MVARIGADALKAWLSDGGEIALLDVREPGQFGEGHLFFAVPLPYSRFEIGLPALVPNPAVRLVLCDGGDGVAERAGRRAEALGYRNVHILHGGIAAWSEAGYTLYAGVNVPSKTFGELVELQRHTPHITAAELQRMREAGENIVIVDGRPFSEYRKMNIPGGICCPNGELALRIGDIAPDPATKIIVNCAGRTRSIVGAQILIDFGVPNPVYALENGTQGWFLAGLVAERGADRRHSDAMPRAGLETLRARARSLAERHGASFAGAETVKAWLGDGARTTYLLDVRSPEEFAASAVAGIANAPGGQLLQATDQWVGVRGARIVLIDCEGVRAPVIASWLSQLGYEAAVLDGGLDAARSVGRPPSQPAFAPPPLRSADAAELARMLAEGNAEAADLRASASYRQGHVAGARWSIRPRIASAIRDVTKTVALVCDEPQVAALAAADLAEAGCRDVRLLAGDPGTWRAAGLAIAATPDDPPDADRIDFLFFTARRHDGDAAAVEASKQYLAWEIGLVDQLDAQERGAFRIAPR